MIWVQKVSNYISGSRQFGKKSPSVPQINCCTRWATSVDIQFFGQGQQRFRIDYGPIRFFYTIDWLTLNTFKVQLFWEGHKNLRQFVWPSQKSWTIRVLILWFECSSWNSSSKRNSMMRFLLKLSCSWTEKRSFSMSSNMNRFPQFYWIC